MRRWADQFADLDLRDGDQALVREFLNEQVICDVLDPRRISIHSAAQSKPPAFAQIRYMCLHADALKNTWNKGNLTSINPSHTSSTLSVVNPQRLWTHCDKHFLGGYEIGSHLCIPCFDTNFKFLKGLNFYTYHHRASRRQSSGWRSLTARAMANGRMSSAIHSCKPRLQLTTRQLLKQMPCSRHEP